MKRIALHSVPRSGSTWVGSILDSSPKVNYKFQPLFSYAFKGFINSDSSLEQIIDFFSQIGRSEDAFINQLEAKKAGLIPEFEKNISAEFICYKEVRYHYIIENLLRKDKTLKVIGLVRNPVSVLSSWSKAPKEFDPNWDFIEEWMNAQSKNRNRREEYYGFNKWLEVTNLFIKLEQVYPDRFLLLEYKDLIENKHLTVRNMFDFCGIPLELQTINYLDLEMNIGQNDPYSIYKTKNQRLPNQLKISRDILKVIMSKLRNTQAERFII